MRISDKGRPLWADLSEEDAHEDKDPALQPSRTTSTTRTTTRSPTLSNNFLKNSLTPVHVHPEEVTLKPISGWQPCAACQQMQAKGHESADAILVKKGDDMRRVQAEESPSITRRTSF